MCTCITCCFSLLTIIWISLMCTKFEIASWFYNFSISKKNLWISKIYRGLIKKPVKSTYDVTWVSRKEGTDIKKDLTVRDHRWGKAKSDLAFLFNSPVCLRFLSTALKCFLYHKWKQHSLQRPCQHNEVNSDSLWDYLRVKSKWAWWFFCFCLIFIEFPSWNTGLHRPKYSWWTFPLF